MNPNLKNILIGFCIAFSMLVLACYLTILHYRLLDFFGIQ